LFSRRLCADVDHLIVPSEQMAAVLRDYGIKTPATVIPTGIRLEEFAGGDGAKFRQRHDIAKDRPMLLTVGRLAIEKNIDFLLDVTRVLVSQFPELLFLIAGEGPDSERLRRRVQDLRLQRNVHFLGNLDRRGELLDCYKAADVFIFASSTETQGLVLVEAMALGVPIVSTAVMGTATVLRNAGGARISTEDVDVFAAHIAELLSSPSLRKTLSDAGFVDATAWSASALMVHASTIYANLASAQPVLGVAATLRANHQ